MILFDTETTGLVQPSAIPLEKQPQIIEFAAVKLQEETMRELGRLQFLCNPGRPLPDKIVQITGITDEELADQPPFQAYYPELAEFFLGERTLVAHNLAFDRDLLRYELLRIGKLLQFPWPILHHCTVEVTQQMKGHRLNLSDLHELATGKPFAGAHRAMADVEALQRVALWLRKEELL